MVTRVRTAIGRDLKGRFVRHQENEPRVYAWSKDKPRHVYSIVTPATPAIGKIKKRRKERGSSEKGEKNWRVPEIKRAGGESGLAHRGGNGKGHVLRTTDQNGTQEKRLPFLRPLWWKEKKVEKPSYTKPELQES